MAVTRIKNNQITDSTVNAAAKLADYTVTGGKLANNLTYGSDWTISGNLTVNGTTSTIDTIDLVVEDPLLLLAKNQTGVPSLDIGYIGKRGTSTNIAFVWDESASRFVTVYTDSENTNTTITINSYASFQTLDLTARNGSFTGNITVTGTSGFTGNITTGNIEISANKSISAGNNIINNVADPVALQDAATKAYVDSYISGGITIADDTANTTVLPLDGTLTLNGTANEVTVAITAIDTVTFGLPDSVTISANLTSGNVGVSGQVRSTGNITGGNLISNALVSSSTLSVTGNANVGNLGTAGLISATGNITGGNLTTAGTANIGTLAVTGTSGFTGNASFGNISGTGSSAFTGNVTGGNLITAGLASIGTTLSVTGNANVGNLGTAGQVIATGNITGGNISTAGQVSATGNITGGNLITAGLASVGTTLSVTGNANVGNLGTAGLISATGNITGGNISTAGQVSATGNVTGGNLITAGLASVGTTLSVTGNANVGNLGTAGQVIATGNVTGGNLTTAGTANIGTLAVTGTSGFTGNASFGNISATGVATVTGNITGGNLITGGQVSATGNITGGNISTAGQVTATGNVSGGNVNTNNIVGTGVTITSTGNLNLSPTGNIVLSSKYINGLSQPVQDNDAASKIYVDNMVSTQLAYHQAVTAATVGNLNAATSGTVSYNNGTAGVGATLTTTGSFTTIDTASIAVVGTRILVKNEANAAWNGVYQYTSSTVITRTTDADTYGPNSSTDLSVNDYFFVTSGSTNAGSAWIVDAPSGTITFGTSNITFAQFSSSQTYTAGNGISINATVISAKTDNNTTSFDGSGNIIVKAGANLTTPNIGAATGTSLNVTGNVTGGNINTGGQVSATGNITGGNLITAGLASVGTTLSVTGNANVGNLGTSGLITATGNITGGNLITAGLASIGTTLSVTGNANVGNLGTSGLIVATGNITGGNLITAGLASVTGNITGGNISTAGQVSATGNVTGGNLITGGLASIGTTLSVTGNANVGNLGTSGLITATGNITGGNLTTAGTANIGTLAVTGTSGFTGNASFGNISATGVATVTGNITGGNISTAGQVSATGNITGGNLITAGLASIGTTLTVVGNANVGNLQTTSLLASGNANVGNLETAGIVSAVGNISGGNIETGGRVAATGNIQGGNLVTGGLASIGTTLSVTGNANVGNLGTAGLIVATGNITGGNISTAGQANLGNIRISGDNITDTNGRVNFNQALADVDFAVNGTAANVFYVDAGSSSASFGNATQVANAVVTFNATNSIKLPVGGTSDRPSVPVTGMMRFNTSLNNLEFYDANSWTAAGTVFTIIQSNTQSGDGTTVAFTLPSNTTTAGTMVAINGVLQIPTSAYSISGNICTFTEAPVSTDVIDFRILTTTSTVSSLSSASGAYIQLSDSAIQADIAGNLIPAANVTYNLGSSAYRWKDLYLSGSSITLGNVVIKNVAGGNTVGFYGPDGTTPATIASSSVDTTQIASGTSSVAVIASGGNIRGNVAGATVFTVSANGIDITGNLSVSGNASLSGNILGDRIQNGTTTIDIQTANGNANISVGGTSNVAVFTTTGANIAGTLNATGNANVGNLGAATVVATTLTGTLSTAAQTNITSVGTLGTLSVTGNANVGNLGATNIVGTLTTASQTNITAVGTLGTLSVTGNANVGNLGAATVVATTLTGTLSTAAQTNITSVGTLGSLTVTNTITGGNLSTAGTLAAGITTITGNLNITGNINATGNLNYQNVTDLVVGDPLIYLGANVVGDTDDLGFVVNYDTGTYQHGGFARDATDGVWKLFGNVIPEPTTTIDFTNAIYQPLRTGAITATGATFSGTVSGTTINAAAIGNSGATLTGTLQTAAQTNITSVGTLTGGTWNANTIGYAYGGTNATTAQGAMNNLAGAVTSGSYLRGNGTNVVMSTIQAGDVPTLNQNTTGYAATVSSAAQANITSVGTLTSLTVSGAITVNSGGAATAIVNGGSNGVGNIGSTTTYFNTVFAKATSAQYADLAEMYESDADYAPGTVVAFGGNKEVTQANEAGTTRVAGVVSTNPSYLMNSAQTGEHVVAVALQGRVPCRVIGVVRKGDLMVAAGYGAARADNEARAGSIIGKALADFNGTEGTIEVVIGRT